MRFNSLIFEIPSTFYTIQHFTWAHTHISIMCHHWWSLYSGSWNSQKGALGFCDRASWANCEVRGKTNKMQQLDVYYQYFLNMFRASLCPSSGEQRRCVTANGVLRWFCWMWSVAVVGRCVVRCEHREGYFSNSNLHSARTPQRSAPQPLPTTSSRTSTAHQVQ